MKGLIAGLGRVRGKRRTLRARVKLNEIEDRPRRSLLIRIYEGLMTRSGMWSLGTRDSTSASESRFQGLSFCCALLVVEKVPVNSDC